MRDAATKDGHQCHEDHNLILHCHRLRLKKKIHREEWSHDTQQISESQAGKWSAPIDKLSVIVHDKPCGRTHIIISLSESFILGLMWLVRSNTVYRKKLLKATVSFLWTNTHVLVGFAHIFKHIVYAVPYRWHNRRGTCQRKPPPLKLCTVDSSFYCIVPHLWLIRIYQWAPQSGSSI